MPESFILNHFHREIKSYASTCGKKALGDSLNPGTFVFHTACCARQDGNRPTVTFHQCTSSDPVFHPLPKIRVNAKQGKRGGCSSCSEGPKEAEEGEVEGANELGAQEIDGSGETYEELGGGEAISNRLDLQGEIVQYPSWSHWKETHGPDIVNKIGITGRLFSAARGKELVLGIGSYVLRICFGLEGHCFWIPTAMYQAIISQGTVDRGEKSKAFPIPHELLDNPNGENTPVISIQAAFIQPRMTLIFVDHNVMISFHVMALRRVYQQEDLTIQSKLWPLLWSATHGPVYSLEPSAMLANLERWRARCIEIEYLTPIFLEVKSNQKVFNGYGAQETCDMLIQAMIHPGMPVVHVCSDASLWERFKKAVIDYQQGRLSLLSKKQFPYVSSKKPFRMNRDGHNRFMACVLCYRRKYVSLNQQQLDDFHTSNLFNPYAVIQANGVGQVTNSLGHYSASNLPKIPATHTRCEHLKIQNYILRIPKGLTAQSEFTVYTPILARPGDDWFKIMSMALVEQDVKNVLDVSTLGSYSFNVFNQCAWTPSKVPKVPLGRRPLVSVSTSKRKRPLADDIAKAVKQPKAKKSKTLLSGDVENMTPVEINTRVTRSGKKVIR